MKKWKKTLTLLLAFCMAALLTLTAVGAGSSAVYMIVNGVPLKSAEAYINENGVTMVPLRAVAEALGFDVSWNPATRTVSITSGTGESRPVVMLDPGHGGSSPGAIYGGVNEKDLDLAIAKKTRDLLEEAGVLVLMTRTGDEDVGLSERTALAAGWCADLFVSIHCNASTDNPEALGIYTCAYSRESEGWALADTLRKTMMASTGAGDMGTAERPRLVVLNTATMPAALVECGYMSTPSELERLKNPEYQALLARGIADGILANLDWEPPQETGDNMEAEEDEMDEMEAETGMDEENQPEGDA